ncbi:MAG: hypothetical protein C4581_02205 [Nitrospiraceae bacterium]|nr:MAG: hypothetical protein C4581_02205 [Nitrospiraceae bacterium]
MILSVHQPQYMPWLGLFDKIAKSDCFVFLDQVQYKEREFQNRNKIRTKDGWMWLTVPVQSSGTGRKKICDVLIDNSNGWRKKHFNSIKTWYQSSLYFNDYIPFFEDILSRETERLVHINIDMMKYILKELEITTPLYYEHNLGISATKTDRIIEICKKFKATAYLSGEGGRGYLEEYKFDRAGIKLIYQKFKHPVYHQQYAGKGSAFIPYMSSVDLLFNEGPYSKQILIGEEVTHELQLK